MTAFYIHARLVCHVHAFLYHCLCSTLHKTPAKSLRSLVYVENIPYAMPCSAFVIHVHIPKRRSRQNIQIAPCASVQPFRVAEIQHSRSHRRVMAFDFIGNGTKDNGSRHVRSAAHVLPAGIYQKHPLRRQYLKVLRRRLIMHHGGVFFIG